MKDSPGSHPPGESLQLEVGFPFPSAFGDRSARSAIAPFVIPARRLTAGASSSDISWLVTRWAAGRELTDWLKPLFTAALPEESVGATGRMMHRRAPVRGPSGWRHTDRARGSRSRGCVPRSAENRRASNAWGNLAMQWSVMGFIPHPVTLGPSSGRLRRVVHIMLLELGKIRRRLGGTIK